MKYEHEHNETVACAHCGSCEVQVKFNSYVLLKKILFFLAALTKTPIRNIKGTFYCKTCGEKL